MAYNYGLVRFLSAKSLKNKETIDGYLQYKGITNFNSKNHNRVNSYIQDNWTNFSSWVDKSLKEGTIKGHRVKLNTYYDEQREYKEKVRQEYIDLQVTPEERKILRKIKNDGIGFIHTFLIKNNIEGHRGKDYNIFSKGLQWLPVVRLAISNGLNLDYETIKNK